MHTSSKQVGWMQLITLYLGLANAFPAVWALGSPQSFYGSFPGFGHVWVAIDGPYNEHLIQDVGAFFLALSVLCFLTAFQLVSVRSTAICLLTFNIPHLLYHLVHLHMLSPSDQVGNLVALSANVLLPVALLFVGTVTRNSQPPL